MAEALLRSAWHCHSAGARETKGERFHDWARVRLARRSAPPWAHWLLVRCNRNDPDEVAYYVAFGPANMTLATLAGVAGMR